MIPLEDLVAGQRVRGLAVSGPVTVEVVNRHGPDTVSVIFTESTGGVGRQLLSRADQDRLFVETIGLLPPLDADANEFKLAAESQRIRLAWLHDPLLAVNTSAVEPLPHQISAVYEHMLPRQPLRYLLADDPGAGKTIMAGLLIKELILRGDVERCLIVVPGNLAEQWQDELAEKFQLIFEIMTNDKLAAAVSGNWLSEHDLVIARLDKLSRDEDLRPKLAATEWDMIIFDEAHKLSASRFGNDIKYTKRFLLAQELSGITRHLLLMTATPHNGKKEDFQLFLSLIDGDRFEGRPRDGARPADCSDLMRRLIKEQLVRFDGSPLFPARLAYTVAYALSEGEAELYEEVTRYVREEFNRAERLDEQRRGTVGFALTVLQRRLASSPAAIHSSLSRRKARLEAQLHEQELLQRGERVSTRPEPWRWLSREELEDLEDAPDMEVEDAEELMMLRASTAQTIEELKAEIATLTRLEALALIVVRGGQDRKWHELSRIIQEEELMYDANGARRKLVIFTEHRDTLTYLTEKISRMIGNPNAVVTIAGGMAREARRAAEAQFKQDPQTHVLVATDAAGEGINLQRAHLMINYDLPWNPNRLEQRFGRIHRIGQTEVCHLWNLVAQETREGQVFQRLFEKLRVESEALGGRVFDILGSLFEGQALRDLLIRAIRAGADGAESDFSHVLGDLERTVDHDHLRGLMEETALAFNTLESSTVQKIREQMERARLRRLQPYFIEAYFLEAFGNLGGAMRPREKRRWEIRNVPVELRRRDRAIGTGAPLLPRYERITFHQDQTSAIQGRSADLVSPGHPLLSTVLDLTLQKYRSHLRTGTILVDRSGGDGDDGRLRAMVVLEHAILEGFTGAEQRQRVASSRLLTVWVYPDGAVAPAGEAPWLDLDTPREDELAAVRSLVRDEWSGTDLESTAISHAASNLAPEHLQEVATRRSHQVEKTRSQVMERLSREIAWWDHRAEELRIQEKSGKTNNRINADNARRKRDELHLRLAERLRDLDNQATLSSQVPVILSVAIVVPRVLLVVDEEASADELTPFESVDAAARKRIELIAMEAVMQEERRRGNAPSDVSAENRGYDIESLTPDGTLLFLEVKGRVSRADTVTVTQSEMRYGFNHPRQFALVVVLVNPDDSIDEPHYVFDPFDREPGWAECDASLWVSRLIERKNNG